MTSSFDLIAKQIIYSIIIIYYLILSLQKTPWTLKSPIPKSDTNKFSNLLTQLRERLKSSAPLGKWNFLYILNILFYDYSPACWDIDMLVKMLDAGMNVARCNFSHGDHKTHGQSLENLQEALKQRPDKTCAVMLDTKGPEIRTGLLRDSKPIELVANQTLKIVIDYAIEGDNTKIACSYKSLPTTVSPGSTIFIADGSLTCEVVSCHDVSIFQ